MKYARISGLSLLMAALTAAGCSQPTTPAPAAKDNKAAPAAKEKTAPAETENHTHGAGPNGGVVFDLGKHHAEFTVDHSKQECTILVLGDDEKTPTPVAATDLTVATKDTKTEDGMNVPAMTIKMLPKDEADGKAAKFVGMDTGLGNVADFEGTVIGEIDGKPSQGTFKE